ncbi:MAG TPA: DUF3618 domain-containing protein [Acidimicrobiales bacterium]|nr:DUF3618 domain-containing protein [Acidimicrobiales bacterium]
MTQSDTNGTGPSNTERLRQEIDVTRAKLGETVETLARKADIKATVRETLDEKRQAFTGQLQEAVTAARDIRDHFRTRHG